VSAALATAIVLEADSSHAAILPIEKYSMP
jgi:hypothetical protein